MLMMRYFEEAVLRLHKERQFASHFHLYIGQEATGAAVLEALGDKDLICTTHRNHGHLIGRGSDPGQTMAEILGRSTGLNRGRGGTLHASDPSRGFCQHRRLSEAAPDWLREPHSGSKPARVEGRGRFFGDGSLEEGLVIESFNIAALWKLPVIYVCENNSAGAMGPQQGGYPTAITATEFHPPARGLWHPLRQGRWHRIAAVYAAATEATQRCRAGQGPAFIEAFTVRWPGSSPLWPEPATVTDLNVAWDPARIKGPHAAWLRDHDPLLRTARDIVAHGYASQDEVMARDKDARARVEAGATFAIESPMPLSETVHEHVFA